MFVTQKDTLFAAARDGDTEKILLLIKPSRFSEGQRIEFLDSVDQASNEHRRSDCAVFHVCLFSSALRLYIGPVKTVNSVIEYMGERDARACEEIARSELPHPDTEAADHDATPRTP